MTKRRQDALMTRSSRSLLDTSTDQEALPKVWRDILERVTATPDGVLRIDPDGSDGPVEELAAECMADAALLRVVRARHYQITSQGEAQLACYKNPSNAPDVREGSGSKSVSLGIAILIVILLVGAVFLIL